MQCESPLAAPAGLWFPGGAARCTSGQAACNGGPRPHWGLGFAGERRRGWRRARSFERQGDLALKGPDGRTKLEQDKTVSIHGEKSSAKSRHSAPSSPEVKQQQGFGYKRG
ncbi:hypothetical protein AALO_G00136890 [Alosa alosa]|uniref:Uncharacterized protein n=1 Tax=Alosa alosa TaxID=278164 RepID=A0AAV6GMB2_9TELE|nr:hypothetical protein AALO_G00136890 [Alosa alosa]